MSYILDIGDLTRYREPSKVLLLAGQDEEQSDSDSSSCWYDYQESIPDNQNSESQDVLILRIRSIG